MNTKVVVSLDFYEGADQRRVKSNFDRIMADYPKVEWIRENKNLGLAKHIVLRVTEALQASNRVVVIEDDVLATSKSIAALLQLMNREDRNSQIMTYGLFGAVPNFPGSRTFNTWRQTPYFSAWGWAINRDKWSLYDLQMIRNLGTDSLNNSRIWRGLTQKQQNRWRRRFKKVEVQPFQTWDFQMQFVSYLYDLVHVLPLFRLCDNVGLGDPRATNTVHARPNWYIGKSSIMKENKINLVQNQHLNRTFRIIDSFSWIGDRKIIDLILG